jgi:metallophosphoesterase (TIGR03767 family)
MGISRRGLARAGAALTAAVIGIASQDRAGAAVRRVATLGATIRRGRRNAKGYARLVRRGGEPHVVRTDLGVPARPGRADRRRPLAAFVQLSDVHVVDVQSPLRVEWTDRFDDPGPTVTGVFASAYRPQEMLSGHIADAMVRRLNRIATGPVTGRPLALAIQTGDNSDNSQYNEVRWNIDLLDGGRVRVDSGDLTRFEGVADDDPTWYDRAYWHPHGAPAGKTRDRPGTDHGFPIVAGLLDAARRPFRAAGLAMPWYTAFGNHDGLAQGNFPTDTLQLNAIATGGVKIISPPAGLSGAAVFDQLSGGDLAGVIGSLAATPGARPVTPDDDRRLLARAELVEEHFTTTGSPVGHGFTAANRTDGTAYYSFDRGRCRFVVLDTVNPNGYANGSIDQTQFDWLKRLLHRSGDKVVLVFSHHTSDTMDNPLVASGGDPEPRVLGDEVLALLLRHWFVVAWVNGHTHRNAITAHRRENGGGMWEINTASHIDWPQQSRIIELTDNDDGTLSIFTTMVDHAFPLTNDGTGDPVQLAALARELAANDWHDRTDRGLGRRIDRNTELLVRMPPRARR